jgi:hypothetical protein
MVQPRRDGMNRTLRYQPPCFERKFELILDIAAFTYMKIKSPLSIREAPGGKENYENLDKKVRSLWSSCLPLLRPVVE